MSVELNYQGPVDSCQSPVLSSWKCSSLKWWFPWCCWRRQTLGNQICDLGCSYREMDSLVRSLCSPWREVLFLSLHTHGSPCLPIPNFYLHPPWPHLRGERRTAVVPCAASPATRRRTSRGRLTAGSLAVPCDQRCVSAATVAARLAPRQAILDRNSSIRPSRQTSATLKVNRNLDRDADCSRGQSGSWLFGNCCSCCFGYMCVCWTWNISQVWCVWGHQVTLFSFSTGVGVE